jgi:hypothetical protein
MHPHFVLKLVTTCERPYHGHSMAYDVTAFGTYTQYVRLLTSHHYFPNTRWINLTSPQRMSIPYVRTSSPPCDTSDAHPAPVLNKHDGTSPRLDEDTVLSNATAAEQEEKEMSPLRALRLYPKAVFWSWAISLCLVMEGYDTTREFT